MILSKKLLKGALMKKPKSKKTPRRNLSITGKPIPDEIDWDLLAELEDQEDALLTMRHSQRPAKSQSSPEPLSDNSLQTIFGKMEDSKKKGPQDSDHWRWKVRQGTPKT